MWPSSEQPPETGSISLYCRSTHTVSLLCCTCLASALGLLVWMEGFKVSYAGDLEPIQPYDRVFQEALIPADPTQVGPSS